jgi:solute carrier family 25 oxoglutarate transporter 11
LFQSTVAIDIHTMTTDTTSENSFAKAFQPFACGGAAATFASIVIHPMDLAKVRLSFSFS